MTEAEAQLERFLGKYLPGIAAQGRGAIKWMRQRLPGCDALVYDNYQALAIGFSPNGKTGASFLSVALYPRWVSLFFLQAAGLNDPAGLLRGSGSMVRHIRLAGIDDLDLPEVRALIDAATLAAQVPYDASRTGDLVIKSVSAKQKPRRPD